jgi:hypothetical protein
MSTNDSPVMSIKELAQTLQIAPATAFGLARKNLLPVPVIFIGPRRMVVSRDAVRRLLAEGKGTEEN